MPDTDFKNRKQRLIKHLNCPTVICGGSKMKKTKNKKKKGGRGQIGDMKDWRWYKNNIEKK